jgi:signal transduction histidine kinase
MTDAAVWSAGWSLAAAAGGAALLAVAGAVSVRIVLALGVMALPGIIGAAWRPAVGERSMLVAVWSLGAALACCIAGGLTGPLAVLCLTPALACLAIEAPWRAGAALSIAAVAVCALAGGLHWLPAPPDEPERTGLTLIALVLTAAAAGGALLAARRRAEGEASAVQAGSATASDHDMAERLTLAETGRREAEAARDRAEAAASARARFLANMSHELRTPLNAIMGFSDMMRARMFGELTPKYAEYADLIHESGGHLLDLINDVLDMSKIEAQRYTLSREVFDARQALNGALRLMRIQADDAGVKLRAVLPTEPLMIDADQRAIKQIALNLLSNALKFTPRDGTVILNAQAAAGALEIVVADTGMGIAAEDLKRLGQPFEQAGGGQDRARGTGLGLSLVDAFAKLHGGTLTLESRLGEGTAATVRMPVLALDQHLPRDAAVAEAAGPD